MSTLTAIQEIDPTKTIIRRPSIKDEPTVLADIYQKETNITIWQRQLPNNLIHAVTEFIDSRSNKATVLAVSPTTTYEVLSEEFGTSSVVKTLSDDIAVLVDMFCCLFDLKRAGLRLTILEQAMCPRFHVDRIPCRLVTTYKGIATQWLDHNKTDRTKLGAGNLGKPDEISGLFKNTNDINQLTEGDVALLKGENWDDDDGTGLVHRSPPVVAGERRLLLTLDFID